jgi:phage-related protein (TIGR01555 family)
MSPSPQQPRIRWRGKSAYVGDKMINIADVRRRGGPMSALQELGISAGLTGTAADMFTNAAARMGWGTPNLAEATDYVLERFSYDYWMLITLYRNHWISRKIVEGPAKDMVRTWPTVLTELEPGDTDKIEKTVRRTATKQKIFKALWQARLFGGAGCLIIIDGHENRLEEPLKLDEIELGAYKGLIPFNRWTGITPDGEVSDDFSKPTEFNLPKYYRVNSPSGGQGFRIHASRILRFCGPDVPSPELEAQQYWGISVLEPVYEEIRKRDNLSWNVLSLTFRANLIGWKDDNLAQMLSGANMNQKALQAFQARMGAMNSMLSNQSMLVIPKDGGMESVNYTFSGLSDVMQQFQMDIAGAAEYPVTRLFGRTVTGLGQANDADERFYEEKIAMDQESELRPQLSKLYDVICASELGEVPGDLDLDFPSVRVLTEEEKGDLASKTTGNIVSLANSGFMDKETGLKEIQQQSKITGFGTNVTNEVVQKAKEEEEMGLGGLGEMAGGGEGGEVEMPAGGAPKKPPKPARERKVGGGEESGESMLADLLRLPQGAREEGRHAIAADSAGVSYGHGISHGLARDSRVVKRYEFAGVPVSVEYPAGVRRLLKNRTGKPVYDAIMQHDYGFIENTVGRDGDEIDVIVGPNPQAAHAYVVDMIDGGPEPAHWQDEDKLLIGFDSPETAKDAFLSMYPESFFGGMGRMTMDELRHRLHYPSNWDRPEEMFAFAFKNDLHPAVEEKEPLSFGGLFRKFLGRDSRDAEFHESEHPRGKGEHGGEFVKKGSGSGGSASKSEPSESSSGSRSLAAAPSDPKQWPEHIKKLKLPPAWKNVRIASDPNADLQAIGEDAKGRAQYVYSQRFQDSQQAAKFARIKELNAKFGEIEAQNARDLKSDDPVVRENAECSRLVMTTGIRPGSEEDTGAKVKAYGATTLKGEHVVQEDGHVYLRFTGKKGVSLNIEVTDKGAAEMLARRAAASGADGQLFPKVSDQSLREYSHTLDGGGFKTKDMRTALGTREAGDLVKAMPEPDNAKEYQKFVMAVAKRVAARLGNTPTVALQSYIHPAVFAGWRAAAGV